METIKKPNKRNIPVNDQDIIKDLRKRLKNTTQQKNKVSCQLQQKENVIESYKKRIIELYEEKEKLVNNLNSLIDISNYWQEKSVFWMAEVGCGNSKRIERNPHMKLVKSFN